MPRPSARIRSFSSRSATRNMSTSSIRSPVFGSSASGRLLRWKQNILPCTWYEGRPSSETSFVTCGIASANASRSAIVAIGLLCQVPDRSYCEELAERLVARNISFLHALTGEMDTRRGHTWGSLRARRVAGIVALATAISVSVLAPLGSAAPGDPAPQVTLSPGALVFADRPVGTRADAQAITLTNTGDAPLTLSTFHLSGPDTADFGLGVMCPIAPDTLQPGASCDIYVSFTPDSSGAKSATLVIGDNAP